MSNEDNKIYTYDRTLSLGRYRAPKFLAREKGYEVTEYNEGWGSSFKYRADVEIPDKDWPDFQKACRCLSSWCGPMYKRDCHHIKKCPAPDYCPLVRDRPEED